MLFNKSRRNLVVLGSTACLFPKIATAQPSRPQPLILGLVTSGSLYPMAVPFSSKGIDWAHVVGGEELTEQSLVTADTVLGARPNSELYAYSSSGQYIKKYWGTDWERHNPSDAVGDRGFITAFDTSLPETYLVSSQLFKTSFPSVTSKLNRTEILKLRSRFKNDVLSELAKLQTDEFAREMLVRSDVIYTGSRTFIPNNNWTVTTVIAKLESLEYLTRLVLTWIKVPGLPVKRYVSFNAVDSQSTEIKGFLQIPGEKFPLLFLGDYNKAGVEYSLSWDINDPSRTASLGGSGC